MKTKLFIAASLGAVLILAGCATPVITPAVPASTNQVTGVVVPASPPTTNYIVPPTVTTITNGAEAVSPLLPPPYSTLLNGLALAVATGFGLYAKSKNDAAQTHQSAAAALAATVVQLSSVPMPTALTPGQVTQMALKNAETNGSVAAVAQHLSTAGSPT